MNFIMEIEMKIEREEDDRWIAEREALPGVLAYGTTKSQAVARARALALRVLADRMEAAGSHES